MDDGKANVMSLQMQAEIHAALDRSAAERPVVVLTGRPGVFSGGFDLQVLRSGGTTATDMVVGGFELASRLLSFPTPVIVAATGHAVAMGIFLLLAGDYRIGAAGPFKLIANEVAIGLTMPYGADADTTTASPNHPPTRPDHEMRTCATIHAPCAGASRCGGPHRSPSPPGSTPQDCLISLFHHVELRQHEHDPPRPGRADVPVTEKAGSHQERKSVKQLPESLSTSNRSRVPKLSPTYRSHNVKHEPKLHRTAHRGLSAER